MERPWTRAKVEFVLTKLPGWAVDEVTSVREEVARLRRAAAWGDDAL